MEFRLLGPMEVLDRGTALALGGLKQRALLARLLVTPNRTVAVDRLVDDLWGEAAPGHGGEDGPDLRVAAAQGCSRTRVLLTRPPGYLVEVDPEAIDVGRFDRLRRTGRAALEAGDAGDRGRAAARGAGALARRGARRVRRALRAGSSATTSTSCAWRVSRTASRRT